MDVSLKRSITLVKWHKLLLTLIATRDDVDVDGRKIRKCDIPDYTYALNYVGRRCAAEIPLFSVNQSELMMTTDNYCAWYVFK